MSSDTGTRRAKAFDIRLVIALLIGVYGAVLTVLGLGFTSDEEITKAAGININLWAGLGMLVFAALFVLWARLRPIAVPTEEDQPDHPATSGVHPADHAPDRTTHDNDGSGAAPTAERRTTRPAPLRPPPRWRRPFFPADRPRGRWFPTPSRWPSGAGARAAPHHRPGPAQHALRQVRHPYHPRTGVESVNPFRSARG